MTIKLHCGSQDYKPKPVTSGLDERPECNKDDVRVSSEWRNQHGCAGVVRVTSALLAMLRGTVVRYLFLPLLLSPGLLRADCLIKAFVSANGSPYASTGSNVLQYMVVVTRTPPDVPATCSINNVRTTLADPSNNFLSTVSFGGTSNGPAQDIWQWTLSVNPNTSAFPRNNTLLLYGRSGELLSSIPIVQMGSSSPIPDPNATTPNDPKQGGSQSSPSAAPKPSDPLCYGMAGYSFHRLLISLNVADTPIGYAPPKGPPAYFTATYNQKEAGQPTTFNYSNLGPKWNLSWLSYVTDDPNHLGQNVTVYARGGGIETYLAYGSGYTPERFTHAVLARTGPSTYEKDFPDGSKEIFTQTDGSTSAPRKIFLTSIVDPAGNAAHINYDSQHRITGFTDAIGQTSTVTYGLAGDAYKITKVTDPFGRSALFSYNGNLQLASIQDPVGMISQFGYGAGNFISSLTTPYGTTNFVYGSNGTNQWLMATDPLNQTERIEYRDHAPGIAATASAIPTGMEALDGALDVSNTFYWDKRAWADFPGDYTKARITHWLLAADGTLSGLASSTKEPLENRVYYTYQPGPANPGSILATPDMQSSPTAIGRILDDGSTQLATFAYNLLGKPTQVIDPMGRETDSVYAANNVNLVQVSQKNGSSHEILFKATYNGQHLPLTTTDAAGQTTTYSYNAVGQPIMITNPKGETTTMVYDGNGYLQTVTGAIPGSTTTFTYDAEGRVQTIKESDGHIVSNAYDNLDRLIKQTFPDGTFRQIVYDRLTVGSVTDRDNRTTTYTNDALGHVVQIKDPLGRVTMQTWCKCGALASLTDPNGNVTTWTRDLQGRATAKTYADGKGDTFLYENTTSRLKSKTDALGQTTTYGYAKDNNLTSKTYTNARNATPNVSFSYDLAYNRRIGMIDGTGTTSYSYYPVNGSVGAGRLAGVSMPVSGLSSPVSVGYTYDQLGRIVSRSINGSANQANLVYDALGRVTSETNPLGTFKTAYVDQTARPLNVIYPNGQSVAFQYFSTTADDRLQEIKNLTGATVLSKFDYTYDAEGQILSWAQQASALNTYALGYDLAGQLTNANRSGASPGTFAYAYDPSGNRTNETINGAANPVTVNDLNELLSRSGANPRSFSYDADGEVVASTGATGLAYQWDAEGRLVSISYPSTNQQTLFSYDGLGRRVKIVEKTGATITSTKQFVWDGLSVAEERDASGNLTKRFYSEGQVNGSTPLFYTRDHLGSVREVLSGTGGLLARYDYDPYGRRTLTVGADIADFGFTGHYYNAPSKLHLTPNRVYSADFGRWLSRDPIAESGGANLFGYSLGDPINHTDPLGLCPDNSPTAEQLIAQQLGIPLWTVELGLWANANNAELETAKWGAIAIGTIASGGILAEGFAANPAVFAAITQGASGINVTVDSGVAVAEVNYVSNITPSLVRQVLNVATTNGAETLIVSTGPIIDADLAIKFGLAAQRGETIFGGVVEQVMGGSNPEFIIKLLLK